jgi:hypothetical protein
VAIDLNPALVIDEPWLAVAHESLDRRVADRRRVEQPAGGEVFEQPVHRLVGVLLVGPDHAAGTALGPADDVLATPHPSALVRDQPALLVERHLGERRAPVADRAEHRLRRNLDSLIARAGAQGPVGGGLERVTHERHRLDVTRTVQSNRREQEAQHDLARLGGERTGGVLAQDLDVALGGGGGGRIGDRLGEFELGRVDDDVSVGQLAELAQLRVGEGRLRAAPAGDHDDLANAAASELVERMVGDVGHGELVPRQHEHAGDVQRDIAGADHEDALAAEVEFKVAKVRMPVVPADEVGGRVASCQLLARDPHRAVGRRTDRVDDRVVVAAQIGQRDVRAEFDVGEEPQSRVLRRALVQVRDRLDLRVIGCHARPNETPRRRQALEEIDVHLRCGVAEQVPGGVAPRRPRTDDRDANLCVAGFAHPGRRDGSGNSAGGLTRGDTACLDLASIRTDSAPLPCR